MGLNGHPASAYRIAKAVRLTVVALLMLILGSCKSNAVIQGLNSRAFIREAGAQQGFESCDTSPKKPFPPVDFSRAGYRQNDTPVPYGQRAATVSFGEGRHTITKLISLKSGDVLRGAGRDKTVLYFPQGLIALGMPCDSTTCYNWSGGAVITAGGSEVGIEELTIEFPEHPWEHSTPIATREVFNGIELNRCTNCWVKNVTVRNADSGIHLSGSSYSTVDGAHVYGNPDGSHIHIGLTLGKGNAVINFKVFGFSTKGQQHGLTGNWKTGLGVFANGTRDNVTIEPDHNCNGKFGLETCTKDMLYSNISGSGRFQSHMKDRKGNPLPSTPMLWNVDKVDRCPLDVYTVQLEKRNNKSNSRDRPHGSSSVT